jgi:hypothetical protein|tara:strand:+ start:12199 stop:12609 length:411 start_codon:yes stop_codon:yes gene_type:complete
MADTVSSTTILDGDKDFIVQLTNVSDSTGESAVTKVDVSGLTARKSDGAACTGVKLFRVYYSILGFTKIGLLWDATTDTLCMELNPSADGVLDFSPFGGLQNTSGSGKTGDINLTTTGASSGDSYMIVLHCIKSYS